MSEFALVVSAHMRALVGRLGCLDAAAETLNARWGGGHSKGTLSRKLNGSLDWTVKDVAGLEDALGQFPVTRLLERRRVQATPATVSILTQAGTISRETGEAIAAILAAEQSDSAHDRAQAVVELDQALEALRLARARLEHDLEGAE